MFRENCFWQCIRMRNRHFWCRVRPETSVTFILLSTGIVLVLFYIYPIVPYAPAFLHCFLLLVTVVKGIDQKRNIYFCLLVLEFFLRYSISYPIRLYAPVFCLHSSCHNDESPLLARKDAKRTMLSNFLLSNGASSSLPASFSNAPLTNMIFHTH